MEKRIPIQNIYYMLSYCAGMLPEKDLKDVDGVDTTDLLELYAQSLVRKLRPFVKRGFYKEYVQEQDELATLKGKVLFKESVAKTSMLRGKLICTYDDFSEDIIHNQIIKATLRRLLQYSGLKKETLADLKKLIPFFQRVSLIELESKHFNNIKLHRNNKKYGFILDVCYIIFQNVLINENTGTIKFVDYNREEKMSAVFEEFIRKFYEIRCAKKFKVKSERLAWQHINVIEGDSRLIPGMQTDITMFNSNTKIIIDAKYYKKTLDVNKRGDARINSNHLYQLFSYLSNTKQFEKMMGILVYPEVDRKVNQVFEMNGYLFKVMTLNLNTHWAKIEQRLMEIIELNMTRS